jgi:hypothetical protein
MDNQMSSHTFGSFKDNAIGKLSGLVLVTCDRVFTSGLELIHNLCPKPLMMIDQNFLISTLDAVLGDGNRCVESE